MTQSSDAVDKADQATAINLDKFAEGKFSFFDSPNTKVTEKKSNASIWVVDNFPIKVQVPLSIEQLYIIF